MSSPTRRPPAASPAKPASPTMSPSRAHATAPISPSRSPSRTTAIRPVPMDVDRESLRKKRAASPGRNDADDESEKSPSKSSPSTAAGDGASSSIDDRPTKRLHGDNSVSGSASAASSKPASSSPSPAKRSLSPTKSPQLPSSAPAAKPALGTGFGALPSTSSPAPSSFSGFAALANKPSVFGSSSSSTTKSLGGGFGAFAASTGSGGGFSALAATAPTTSIFVTASASAASSNNNGKDVRDTEGNQNDDDDNDAHADETAEAEPAIHFQPVVHLEQQQVVTGEEDEETVAVERAKLFLPDAEGKPKERGIGNVKVNVRTLPNGERRARVLMRADGVHNVLVNAPLLPGMSCNVSDRVLQFGALVDGKLLIHMFRFKTAVPCSAIAAAIRDNVPEVPLNGDGSDDNDQDEDQGSNGDEAV